MQANTLDDPTRSLPWDSDAEKGVLSCFLHTPDLLSDAQANVPDESFYHPANQLLFQVMKQFHEGGTRPVEYIALTNYLRDADLLGRIGGAGTLSELLNFVPTPAHYGYYKGILLDKLTLRKIALYGERLASRARAHHEDVGIFVADEVERSSTVFSSTMSRSRLDFTVLALRRINPVAPPPKPETILRLNGHEISTPGNLTGINAQAKAGKTAVVGAIWGAMISAEVDSTPGDCLEFEAQPPNGKAVLLFDTEQSPHDAAMMVLRGMQRAGVPADSLPKNFRPYSVLDIPTARRRAFFAAELERSAKECGGVHCVLLDGVADLIVDPNNPEEAFGFVDELVRLAVRFECPIITVLHENPASQANATGKTRGHLGSQLERKAESNLRIMKDGENSVLFSERCRRAHISKEQGICFTWSNEKQMHVTCATSPGEQAMDRKRGKHADECEAVFQTVLGPISWADLSDRIEKVAKVKGGTISRRITDWQELGLIEKNRAGLYLRKRS
jgi:hypothetical protein